MDLEAHLSSALPRVDVAAARAVLELVEQGATAPFIARYRKERIGRLDEAGVRAVIDAKADWDAILARQAFIAAEVEGQGRLDPALRERIASTFDREALEDLYLPFKRKRRSKAALAREQGLEPLADWIWGCGHGTETPQPGQTLELWAFTFHDEAKGVPDAATAIAGATDILVERVSEDPALRALVRRSLRERGTVVTWRGKRPKEDSRFVKYFERSEPISALFRRENAHRYLAIRRGIAEEELLAAIEGPSDDPEFEARLLAAFEASACGVPDSPGAAVLREAATRALREQVRPAIEAEIHKALRAVADDVAIDVCAENVGRALLAPPFGRRVVIGIDPDPRRGGRAAVVGADGGPIATFAVPTKGEDKAKASLDALASAVREHDAKAVAVGNGPGGRDLEGQVRRGLAERGFEVPVVLVNEAGVGAWAAGDEARAEMPDLDPGTRGAVSIARRLQDPLSEIVKVDPRTVGAGQYHADVPPHRLKKRLDEVVETCVHRVGLDLNAAPVAQLSRIAGLGPVLAEAVAEFRARSGPFRSRRQLAEAARLDARAFEQVAGFVRVADGESRLDGTRIHPERQSALEAFAAAAGLSLEELLAGGVAGAARVRGDEGAALRRELGQATAADVAEEIERPAGDPRGTWEPIAFRDDVASIEDLRPGMVCPGVVTNVTAFGAFVDVGAKQDGLVHVSRLSDRFVGDPAEVVSPGDRVRVRVVEVDVEKRQVSLTMRSPEREGRRGAPARADREARGGDRLDGRGAERARGRRGGEHGGDRRAAGGVPPVPGAGDRERPRGPRRREDERRDGRGGARPSDPSAPSTPRGLRADERRDRGRPGGGDRRDDGRPRDDRPRDGDRARDRGNDAPRGGGPRKPAQPFNNPFASLLSIKDSFRKS